MIARRVLAFLVEDLDDAEREDRPERGLVGRNGSGVVAPRPVAVVLCGGRDALALASAVALVLARDARVPLAAIAVWRDNQQRHEPAGALPGATRLARALNLVDVPACASGRLTRVELPSAAAEADRTARLLLSQADVPVAIALAGLRDEAHDGLVAGADRVIVCPPLDAPAGLTDCALATARQLAPEAVALDLPLGPATRAVLSFGLFVTPRVRARLIPVLRSGA